jgi:hypothetical protein
LIKGRRFEYKDQPVDYGHRQVEESINENHQQNKI